MQLARKLLTAGAMQLRDSFVLTSLLLATACPASPAATTDPGTTDDPTTSTGDASSGGTTGPTTGTDAPTTGAPADTTADTTATTGTTGEPAALPETCADVLAGDPGAADGEYTLYVGGAADQPWPAYCHDMAGTPAEYLVLVNLADGRNFSQYTNADPQGEDLRTAFTRVRI
ncbi:MAG: hypothetical protein JNK56_12905, partial [Myxococcales bacterium]|nr:hypothetical protein [Myxococcales bacterium]